LIGFWCFNATFNNISAISWRPVLVVEKPEYPERTTDHGQATGKLYHLRLRVEWTLLCNLQSRARTHTVLVIGYSTTKTGRHDIAEILLKVALKHQKPIKQCYYILIMYSYVSLYYTVLSHFMNFCVIFHTFHFCTNYKTIHMSLASSCIYRPSSGFWSKNRVFFLGPNFLKM
jgi:hypothetical protein